MISQPRPICLCIHYPSNQIHIQIYMYTNAHTQIQRPTTDQPAAQNSFFTSMRDAVKCICHNFKTYLPKQPNEIIFFPFWLPDGCGAVRRYWTSWHPSGCCRQMRLQEISGFVGLQEISHHCMIHTLWKKYQAIWDWKKYHTIWDNKKYLWKDITTVTNKEQFQVSPF